ncbi:pirin family protein [Paenibacillus eucommiae]|uniref:Redox-sensitive bicupin YhaK (Pirin superfamily) n=1 Tax=Paenibacillus eucommiae TaxID=1355755 RepID=A0ABS4IQ93_9BACL|nr:pirin family protein [Paenibacillus eucommiae]MBP1989305.1 redox-sensitive bicupin YhaK (pirin superfamily) [Paenibacillus eucommiae]
MLTLYPAASRHSFDRGWIRGNYSFSFGDYEDPNHHQFGPLRVFNDDTIAPGRGFGAHPHSDMEIVSIVLSGQLRHEDNQGNEAVTSFGEIQRMSAGSGIIHTEHNSSETEELNLLQMWFMPSSRGLAPSYEMTRFDPALMTNNLLPVVAQQGSAQVAAIHQDMTIYLSKLDGSKQISFTQAEGRKVFIFVIEGHLTINEHHLLETRDSARITDIPCLELGTSSSASFVLIDLP